MRRLNIKKTCFAQVCKALATVVVLLMTINLNAQDVVLAGTYYDPGGANNAYQIGSKQFYKICPSDAGKKVIQLEFTQYDISNGTTLSVAQNAIDCTGTITASSVNGVPGQAISNAPNGSIVTANGASPDGCLTVTFDATNATAIGGGYTLHAKEIDRPNYSFPLGGTVQAFSFSPDLCTSPFDLGVQNIPVPTYTDANGCTLEMIVDCTTANISSSGNILTGQVGFGETTITFTSPTTGEVVNYIISVYPKVLGCNDDLNVSLSNDCVVALTPDMFLEGECETTGGNVTYEIQFQNPNTQIVGQTVEGYPITDFSGVPCGTKLNVLVRRTIQLDCGSQANQIDWCWGVLTIEDQVAPILGNFNGSPTTDIDEILCTFDRDDLLNELNKIDDQRTEINLVPNTIGASSAASTAGGTLVIEAIADVFEVFDNCNVDYEWTRWTVLEQSCQDGGLDFNQAIRDAEGNILELADFFDPAGVNNFKIYFRTIRAVDGCGNRSNAGMQVIRVVQPEIVAPLPEFEFGCEEDTDPIAIYNKWASNPEEYYYLAWAIPNFDQTPVTVSADFGSTVLQLNAILAASLGLPQNIRLDQLIENDLDFELFQMVDPTSATAPDGIDRTVVPAFPEHAACGYAIEWTDSKEITLCENTFKVFREWTIYNWCDGHLELIDLIPQVLKVGDTKAPFIVDKKVDFVGFAETNNPNSCLTDAIINFEIEDECSSNTEAYISIDGGREILLELVGDGYRLSNLPVGVPISYTIRLIDDCRNQSVHTDVITLEDNIPPVAICESTRVVAMGIECETIVRAEAFDDGSFDNCGQVSFAVACADDVVGDYTETYDIFQPTVTFTKEMMAGCEGTKTVIFRVADGSGIDLNNDGDFDDENERYPNYNYCEVTVTLQDAIPPSVEDQTIILSCDSEEANLLATAALQGEEALQNFINSGAFVYPNGVAYISAATDNCDNTSFSINSIDASGFDADCRQGSIRIIYQAVDACGNVSLPAAAFITVVATSDWEMHFPKDILIKDCIIDISLPPAANIDDILINNGCDEWGLNVIEENFAEGEGSRQIVRSYHLINFCTWNPSNTEIAIVERPDELILDSQIRDYTVALRYQDNRTVELDANGNVVLDADGDAIVLNDNLPDGINDIDDGNEDDDFASNRKSGGTLKSFDYSNPFFLYKNRSDREDFTPITIPLSSEQLKQINDADEAEDYDYYDVTNLPFDGDFVILDNFDFPYQDIEAYTATSQFSGEPQRYVSAQHYGNIIYRQIIRILDLNAPVIEVPEFDAFCAEESCEGEVIIAFKATDPCGGGVTCDYSGVLNYLVDGEQPFDLGQDTQGEIIDLGEGNFEIRGNYPIGIHQFTIVAGDDVNNTSTFTFEFEVIDCKPPVAKCHFGLVVDLMQNGTVTLPAEWFNKGSFDECSDEILVTFADPKIYPDSTQRTFSCNRGELGLVAVSVWVMDAAGNTSRCETFVDLERNEQNGQFDLCPTQGASIGGMITTESGSPVEQTEVNLSGTVNAMYPTATDGGYEFVGLETGYDYSITPHKDNDPLNGITTYDLLLLSKHILGLRPLESPYQLIAADANNSGTITTYDMIVIRKLILGVSEQLPNNTAWRFIPADYEFQNPTNPFGEEFPEVMNMNDLATSYMSADFIAVKVGDLNGSVVANASEQLEGRSTQTFNISTPDATLAAGETTTITFTAEEIAAYQFTMELGSLEVLAVNDGNAKAANFGIFEHTITASWNADATNTYSDEDIVFSLLVRATERTRLSDALKITSSKTPAIAYNHTGSVQSVALHFTSSNGYSVTQNYPNPFTTETTISITSPAAQAATLTIQDLNGRVLKVVPLQLNTGSNEVRLEGKDFSKGIYYYTVSTTDFSETNKMAVL